MLRRCRLANRRVVLLSLLVGFVCLAVASFLQSGGFFPDEVIQITKSNQGSRNHKKELAPPFPTPHAIVEPPEIDEAAINRLFPKFLPIAELRAGPHRSKVKSMMARRLPEIDKRSWRLHSPAGRSYTVRNVQLMAVRTLKPGYRVPNVAHYVLPFGNSAFSFHHMVSMISCLHVMRPDYVLLWYARGRLPSGFWWQRVRSNLSSADWERRIVMIDRRPPSRIYSVPVQRQEHQSDVMRLEALLTFGGVYLDLDVLVLKPLEPLRIAPCTIGREIHYGLCNAAIFATPSATFLALWHVAYQVFNDEVWAEHSVWLPNNLQEAFPSLCKVEQESMMRPNWTPEEVVWIYELGQQKNWDWRRRNYMVHLWFRKYGQQHDLNSIRQLDSMYGEMCRFILFGTDRIISESKSELRGAENRTRD